MTIELDPTQLRVLGCMLEKAVLTPDQYPLTLNALVSACNQKSSRDPVMTLESGTVLRTLRQLEDRHLVASNENFRSRVEKFQQRFCNTPYADYQFEPDEYAVITLLMLRGEQTPGELRSRSGRLHEFADNAAVQETLERLLHREGGPLVARRPRAPGRRDHCWVHCFGGAVESVAAEVAEAPASRPAGASRNDRLDALEARVARLEAALAALTGQALEDG